MEEHNFYIKPKTDLSKYGFVHEKYGRRDEWVLWKQTRRLWASTKDNLLHFNMVDKETLSVFYQMIKDDVIIYKFKAPRPRGTHYLTLNDEEFELINKLRSKENE